MPDLNNILNQAAVARIQKAFLQITGPDATRWLNGMVTNSIQSLHPGEGSYNFLLNSQGRIQADCTIYRKDEGYILETDTSQIETVTPLLDKFIIMDDVELNPLNNLEGIVILGPQALSTVSALGTANKKAAACSTQTPPAEAFHLKQTTYAGADVLLMQLRSELLPQYELWSDEATIAAILTELSDTQTASAEDLEALRILEGRPKFGVDIRDKDLPQETNQPHALHFNKGCYLGQEIVERIRSRGQVHRLLTKLELTGTLPTEFPAPLEANGKSAGEITSAAEVDGRLLALGYVRREALDLRQILTYAGGEAMPRAAASNTLETTHA